MLNSKLTSPELVAKLEKSDKGKLLDTIDVLNTELSYSQDGEGFAKIPIRQDRKILGRLHHIFNIQNYKRPDFRKQLLLHADPSDLIEFLKNVRLISDSTKTLSDSEIFSFCDKASKLPWSNNLETKSFVQQFGYDDSLIPLIKEEKDDEEDVTVAKIDPQTGEISLSLQSLIPFRQLYPYQSRVFYEADELIEKRMMKFIIQMPTGSGKTRVAMEIASHFLNRGILNDEKRQIIWLAEKEELLEQAIESFQNVFPHLGLKDVKLYRLFSGHKPSTFEKNSIIMANYPSLMNFLEENPDSFEPDLIICDEAHSAIADTYKPLIQGFHDRYRAKVIGLTATPIRGVKTKENDELKDFFNERIIRIKTDENSSDSSITFLQKKGYLSHIHSFDIDTGDMSESIPKALWRAASKARDLSPKFLEAIAEDNDRNRIIATKLLEIIKNKKRVLYFGTNIFQSKLMCAIMILNGINAVHIDGSTPHEYRRDCIKKFKTADVDIICNCDVFTTGFDEPKIEVVVIGRPTKSIVLNQQMIGRGMRGPKMGGTKEFDLYRINDDLPGIDLANTLMGDSWLQYD